MHRYIISFLLITFCLNLGAQTNRELRDSLTQISNELAKNPGSVDLRLRKAGLNLRLEQWDYACDEYNHILFQDPKNVSALYFRAYVYEKLGKYNFARHDYQTLLAIVPGHFEAQLGLALLNQKDKHYTEALDMLNILCARYPERSEAFASRAGVEAERGLFDLAEYDYGEAVRLAPDNIDYQISYIDLLLKTGRKTDARNKLDDLVKKGIPRPNLEDLFLRAK